MPSNIPPGYAMVAWRFQMTGDNEEMISTCGVDTSALGGAYQEYLDHVADSFVSAWTANLIMNVYTFKGCRMYVGQDGGASAVYEENRTHVGTGSSGPLPSNCAFLVRKLTAQGGRAYRGRGYWPPFCMGEQSVDQNGMIDTTTWQARAITFNLAYNALRGPSLNCEPVLLHRPDGPPIPPTVITDTPLQQRIATMRRRMRR